MQRKFQKIVGEFYGDNNLYRYNKSRRRFYLLIIGTLFLIVTGVVYLGKFKEVYKQRQL